MAWRRGATIVLLFLTACSGSGSGSNRPILIDSSTDDAPSCEGALICNVLAQTGCNDGEKCAHHQPPNPCRIPGCVPDGTLPAGAACDELDDQCTAGSLCVEQTCRAYCDPAIDASCAANETCTELHPDDGYGVCL